MQAKSWSYMPTAGAWIATVDGGEPTDIEGRLSRVIDVVRRAADGLGAYHRPRHVAIAWAEIDERGEEVAFHEDERDAPTWEAVLQSVEKLRCERAHGTIETVFVELDTEVELDTDLEWLDHAGELQVSIGEVIDGSRMSIAVVYRTTIDLWLSENTTTRALGTDNRELAAKNHPRLQRTLERFGVCLEAPLAVSDSDRYRNCITPCGFVPDSF